MLPSSLAVSLVYCSDLRDESATPRQRARPSSGAAQIHHHEQHQETQRNRRKQQRKTHVRTVSSGLIVVHLRITFPAATAPEGGAASGVT